MSRKICIKLLIEQPVPEEVSEHAKKESLQDKCERCCKAVESNVEESEVEWNYLKRLYEVLSKKKGLNKAQKKLLDRLEELMQKYGSHDHSGGVQIDGQNMNRGKDNA